MVKLQPKHIFIKTGDSRQAVLIGCSILAIAIALTIGMFVQISGYRLITIDQRDSSYPSVIARQITHDAPISPFAVSYPVLKNQLVDGKIQIYANYLINQYMNERSNRTDTTTDEQLQVGYQIRWYDSRTVTADFTRQKHQTNRIWDKSTDTLTFDLVTGKQITPKEIIKNSFNLANILYDYRRTKNTPGFTSAELIDVLDLDARNITSVVPYGDRVSFTYTINNKVDTVAVQKSLLGDIIQPQYQSVTHNQSMAEPGFVDTVSTMPSRNDPVNPNGKKLALTFDDGPGSDTPRLLDALYKYRAHATFFVIGKNVDLNVGTIQREIVSGHEIGNHTWGHPNLRGLSGSEIAQQIQSTQTAIQQAGGGYTPRLVRPPYGSIDARVEANLQGLAPTLWTVDTNDWLDRDTDIIYDRIMAGARQNSIILLHDIHPKSVDAAIRAIRQLRADGWQLVTVSQL